MLDRVERLPCTAYYYRSLQSQVGCSQDTNVSLTTSLFLPISSISSAQPSSWQDLVKIVLMICIFMIATVASSISWTKTKYPRPSNKNKNTLITEKRKRSADNGRFSLTKIKKDLLGHLKHWHILTLLQRLTLSQQSFVHEVFTFVITPSA